MREVTHRYIDPLEAIWLALATRVGWRIDRSSEVYASTDGRGRVTLGTPETLDADDGLAQMIFHELCHAAVQGPLASQPDWGLDNTSERDVEREHACLRLQAALSAAFGLRAVLAPTTDFRSFYDTLPADPLDGDGLSSTLAREGLNRLRAAPWWRALQRTLEATRTIAQLARDLGANASVGESPMLWALVERGTTPLPQ